MPQIVFMNLNLSCDEPEVIKSPVVNDAGDAVGLIITGSTDNLLSLFSGGDPDPTTYATQLQEHVDASSVLKLLPKAEDVLKCAVSGELKDLLVLDGCNQID